MFGLKNIFLSKKKFWKNFWPEPNFGFLGPKKLCVQKKGLVQKILGPRDPKFFTLHTFFDGLKIKLYAN